jgi:hypothetical protein
MLVGGIIILYDKLLSSVETLDAEAIIRFLSAELPSLWIEEYSEMTPRPAHIVAATFEGYQYLFDYYSIFDAGGAAVSHGRTGEDRLVAVFGLSSPPRSARDRSRMRGWCGATEKSFGSAWDKGHFIAHSIGGGLAINVFQQRREVNRGWSEEGKLYRSMERYCSLNPGSFCFSRPFYENLTGCPSALEFGLLQTDGSLWVEHFKN